MRRALDAYANFGQPRTDFLSAKSPPHTVRRNKKPRVNAGLIERTF
jgi:hypothetical protein